MSPHAGQSLVSEIAPRIRAVVPRSVRPVGSENIEEASKPALWYGNLKAAKEKLACRKRHRGV